MGDWIATEGYRISDVSATESCDYLAVKDRVKTYVEIKGTTGRGEAIILTKNEVALHQARFPHTMLMIVSGIVLDKSADPPLATSGVLRVLFPCEISGERLTALSNQYVV